MPAVTYNFDQIFAVYWFFLTIFLIVKSVRLQRLVELNPTTTKTSQYPSSDWLLDNVVMASVYPSPHHVTKHKPISLVLVSCFSVPNAQHSFCPGVKRSTQRLLTDSNPMYDYLFFFSYLFVWQYYLCSICLRWLTIRQTFRLTQQTADSSMSATCKWFSLSLSHSPSTPYPHTRFTHPLSLIAPTVLTI